MFWVYILRCSGNSYYTGHTDNLENRIAQHQNRTMPNSYTSTRLPIQLMYSQEFSTHDEALIKKDWVALTEYAKRKNSSVIHAI